MARIPGRAVAPKGAPMLFGDYLDGPPLPERPVYSCPDSCGVCDLPPLPWSRFMGSCHAPDPEEVGMPRSYPPEFRRKVLDLLKAGRTVAQVAADLQISDQTIYVWRRQDLIDSGQLPGLSSTDNAELVAARRRIVQLETELAVTRRANELLKEAVPPKASTRPSR